jgi:primosomal protein N'
LEEKPNVVIVLARCSQNHQLYGMRMEEKLSGQWMADWAFIIKEITAKKEGYDRTVIHGSFSKYQTFPGCPHCHALNFFQCGSCKKVTCWNGESRNVVCAWCGNEGKLEGAIESLGAGDDR